MLLRSIQQLLSCIKARKGKVNKKKGIKLLPLLPGGLCLSVSLSTEYPMFVCGFVATPLIWFGLAFIVSPSLPFRFFSLRFPTLCLLSASLYSSGQDDRIYFSHSVITRKLPVWSIGHINHGKAERGIESQRKQSVTSQSKSDAAGGRAASVRTRIKAPPVSQKTQQKVKKTNDHCLV